MLDWSTCQAVERDPLKVSGAWVFRGTRVPVNALFENIEGRATVNQFVQWFPGVAREQIDAVLEHAARSHRATRSDREVAIQRANSRYDASPKRRQA